MTQPMFGPKRCNRCHGNHYETECPKPKTREITTVINVGEPPMTQPPNSDVEKVASDIVKRWSKITWAGSDPSDVTVAGDMNELITAISAALQPSGGDAVAAEREACAKVAEEYVDPTYNTNDEVRTAEHIAAAIRARTPTPQETK